MQERVAARMPVGFVGHGAPTVVLDPDKGAELAAWANAMPRPAAVLVISAHWETGAPPAIGTVETRGLMYDFGGFPDRMYQIQYAAPGAPDVAKRVAAMVDGVRHAPERALDHGVWTPLYWMYPDADVPVVQLSLPRVPTGDLLALGRSLAPLRDEGVFILGSGNVTHNLGRVDFRGDGGVPAWAQAFDQWCAETVSARDWDALADFERRAPEARLNHPTVEHFTPMLVCAGAAESGVASFPITGFEFGSLSRRSIQLT